MDHSATPVSAPDRPSAVTIVPPVVESPWQRAAPFLFAIAVGLALIPLQDVPVDGLRTSLAIAMLALILLLAVASTRLTRGMPTTVGLLLTFAYLGAIALLRSGTGGTTSGYASLLFLAPFWVAIYGTRLHVLIVTFAMFVTLVAQGLVENDFTSVAPLRGALLATVVIGFISLAVNRALRQLRTTKAKLRAQAEQLTAANAELASTNNALERSNRDLEQFAYVSSHDLQEPLRMIRSFSQLFLQRHGERLDDEGRELIGFVASGAERAQRLVTDLLDFSRVGTSSRPFEDTSLDDALDRALQTLDPVITEAGATIAHATSLPTVHGDPAQLERLFVNLISNAIRYRHVDRAPAIRVEGHPVGKVWSVTISDNGIGFEQEHAVRIFKMFQRLHGRDEYAAGTGIGLAICERIVERHGGTIAARGTPGVGAEFTFTLEAVS